MSGVTLLGALLEVLNNSSPVCNSRKQQEQLCRKNTSNAVLALAVWKWLVGRGKNSRWGKQAELTQAGVCQKHRSGLARGHGSMAGVRHEPELLKCLCFC